MNGTRLRAWSAAALAMTVVGALSACSSGSSSKTSSGPIKIGVMLTLSGPAAALGQHELAGAKAALAKINAAGGVDGRKVEISSAIDTGGDANKAVSTYKRLEGNSSNVAIFGPTFGTETLPIAPIFVRDKTPMIIPQTLGDGLPGNKYAFLAAYTSRIEADAARDWLNSKGYTRAAILHTTDQYGSDGAKYLAQMAGIQITANEAMDPGALDVTSQLTKIRGTNPQALLIWGTAPNTGIAIKDIGQLGMTQPILSGVAADSTANIQIAAGSAALARWNVQAVVDPSKPLPRQAAGVQVLTAANHRSPDVFDSIGYDCMYILAEGLKNAGSKLSRASLRDALSNISGLELVDGIYTFKGKTNAAGLGKDSILLLTVENGQFKLATS
jgi:branched-chain amino acid transport system substrate-binding protein